MHVIIFEVYPKQGKADDYFEMAAELKPLLEEQPGFIAVERFQSLNDSQKYLSISSWESEEAIKNWRENIEHQQAQNAGKTSIFSNSSSSIFSKSMIILSMQSKSFLTESLLLISCSNFFIAIL